MNPNAANGITILIVEEQPRLRERLAAAVDDASCRLIPVATEAEAINCLGSDRVNILIAPLRADGFDGAKLLRLAQRLQEDAALILTVEPNTLDTDAAVRLMANGAHDFVVKPVNGAKLKAVVQKAIRQQEVAQENRSLHQQLEHPSARLGFTGKSARMREVYNLIVRYAAAPDTTVLITGESGSGKEVAARAIHSRSPRRDGPFVSFNCAALPESLIESELFGHEPGAFTGANRRRRGRFELADSGTLVLDEIGEMPLAQQAKLLRILETREFERVGGEKPVRTNVRIVATTNRDLKREAFDGRFRDDLYHRLRVATLTMPPLRERVEDIPLLADTFIREFSEANASGVEGITPRALRVLEQYPWHGNVRELKNSIEVMVIVAQKRVLDVDDLPDWLRGEERRALPPMSVSVEDESSPVEPVDEKPRTTPIPAYAGMTWGEIERETIRTTLEFTEGNKAEAARVLGIGRRTLFRKIKEYRL